MQRRYQVGKKFYAFGKPLNNEFTAFAEWPCEIPPRSRVGFYPGPEAKRNFRNGGLYDQKEKKVWEAGRGYAMTECNKLFRSRRLSRNALQVLREAEPLKLMTEVG